MADVRIKELKDAVSNLIKNLGVGIFEGNKIIEVKNTGISKGRITEIWLKAAPWDFVLARRRRLLPMRICSPLLPPDALSIKIGLHPSKARFNVDTIRDLRLLLKAIKRRINSWNYAVRSSAPRDSVSDFRISAWKPSTAS